MCPLSHPPPPRLGSQLQRQKMISILPALAPLHFRQQQNRFWVGIFPVLNPANPEQNS